MKKLLFICLIGLISYSGVYAAKNSSDLSGTLPDLSGYNSQSLTGQELTRGIVNALLS